MNADRLNRLIGSLDDAVKKLRAGSAYRLVQRNARSARGDIDGYPTRSLGGSRGSGIGDPTYATADRRRKQRGDLDPVDTLVTQLEAHLEAAAVAAHAAVKAAAKGDELATPGSQKRAPVSCLACNRTVLCTADDTVRGGHCSACDAAWRRHQTSERAAGREPDLVVFRNQRPKVA